MIQTNTFYVFFRVTLWMALSERVITCLLALGCRLNWVFFFCRTRIKHILLAPQDKIKRYMEYPLQRSTVRINLCSIGVPVVAQWK